MLLRFLAKILQRRVEGFVYDVDGRGGWIYGKNWYLPFARRQTWVISTSNGTN